MHGWNDKIPHFALFFGLLKHRPDELSPWNMFIHGPGGTGKTKMSQVATEAVGKTFGKVDASTLGDVAELFGVPDLRAMREESANKLIPGKLLQHQVVGFDEHLNVAPHVGRQLRGLFQRWLMLYGNPQDVGFEAIISTGNLTTDMKRGQAQTLDSPSADRFVILVESPSLADMNPIDMRAAIRNDENPQFDEELKSAIAGIEKYYDEILHSYDDRILDYICGMLGELKSTHFRFETRRAQSLRLFLAGAIALCEAQKERDLFELISAISYDVMRFHVLSGLTMEDNAFKTAHAACFKCLGEQHSVDAMIARELDPATKVALTLDNLDRLLPNTRIDVFSEALRSNDPAILMALQRLANAPIIEGQPAELRRLLQRLDVGNRATPVSYDDDPQAFLRMLGAMSSTERVAYAFAHGNEREAQKLLGRVEKICRLWKIAPPEAGRTA